MAIFRSVQMSFWTDAKVTESFTPQDRFLYLYLLTNPHTNLAGCYELGIRQAQAETGYSKATIVKVLKRLEEVHGVIKRSQTGEVLVTNWYRYNWTLSEKFRKALLPQIEAVKDEKFKKYLLDLYENSVSIRYPYRSDTTVTVTDIDIDKYKESKKKEPKYVNFDQREYDFKALEAEVLSAQERS